MAEEVAVVEPQETEDELISALEGKGKGEVEVKKDEEEVKKDEGKVEKTEEELKKEEGEGEVETLRGEVRDLRQMLRTSKREITQTQARFDRLSKKPAEVVVEGSEEEVVEGAEKKVVEEPLSRVEQLQAAIVDIGQTKGAALDVLLETMEQNESYKDIRDVCSRANFDDLFEVIASESSKETGKDIDEALLEVEHNIWSKANPYKYMYDLIKKYHPSYAEVKTEKGAKPGEKKELVKAPGSIGDLGGDADIKSGWTAKRIDDLPEDELGTIPKDVYDKYMRGELK